MPKTSNLRSELIDIAQAGDKSFVITVSVWEIPGSKDSASAIRFQFQTHKNPSLWWRLSMTSARQVGTASRAQARYTNAQYNKALRTATDAMNAFIMNESDRRAMEGKGLQPNAGSGRLKMLTYGTMPSEVDFLISVAERLESPFAYYMRLNSGDDAAHVEHAAEIADIELSSRGGMTTITSPRDMYKLIEGLRFMGDELGNERAMDIASALIKTAGYEWV
jgi:hypothetical protein